jgi:hypothetical protein
MHVAHAPAHHLSATGAIFWLFIMNKDWHRNRRVGLRRLNEALNVYYRAHDGLTKVTPLSMSQIVGGSPPAPSLKAKAAQTRHLVPFCAVLAQQFKHGGVLCNSPFRFRRNHRLAPRVEHHNTLLVCLFTGLQDFLESSANEPFDQVSCKAGMYRYLTSLSALNSMWTRNVPESLHNAMPFHLRLKAHACQHLVEDKIPIFGSPFSFWCYRDEDFIGHVKAIAFKSMHPAHLEQRVIEKLRILSALERH